MKHSLPCLIYQMSIRAHMSCSAAIISVLKLTSRKRTVIQKVTMNQSLSSFSIVVAKVVAIWLDTGCGLFAQSLSSPLRTFRIF